jgi:hypothetical protein
MVSEGSATKTKFRCARFVCQKRKWLPKNVEAPERKIDFEGTLSVDVFSTGMVKPTLQELKSLLDRASTGSSSDLVSDRHALFAKDFWTLMVGPGR